MEGRCSRGDECGSARCWRPTLGLAVFVVLHGVHVALTLTASARRPRRRCGRRRAVPPSWLGVGTTSLWDLTRDSAAPGKIGALPAAPSVGLSAGSGSTGRNAANLLR